MVRSVYMIDGVQKLLCETRSGFLVVKHDETGSLIHKVFIIYLFYSSSNGKAKFIFVHDHSLKSGLKACLYLHLRNYKI